MRARNAVSYADYAAILDTDPQEYEQLLDALTINVTKFFRNWPTFESVMRNVVPALCEGRTDSHLECWLFIGRRGVLIAALFLSARISLASCTA